MQPGPANLTDGDRRARVLELQTGVQPAAAAGARAAREPRATGAITLDGPRRARVGERRAYGQPGQHHDGRARG
jgi:hypothetical protein